MNRRRFLITSACAASFASSWRLSGQEVAIPAPYAPAPAALDQWMTAAIADVHAQKINDMFIASINKEPKSDLDRSTANVIILPEASEHIDKKTMKDAVAVRQTDIGTIFFKTSRPKPTDNDLTVYGLPDIVRFAGGASGMWWTNMGMGLGSVRVPLYFVTDLASIPALLWSKLPPSGSYMFPAIVHDWLYWNQGGTKDEADDMLRAGMEKFNVPKGQVKLIYEGVHLAGQSAWDNNAKLKAQGEKRVMTIHPIDPLVTWQQWKNDPSHFAPIPSATQAPSGF